MQTNFGAVHVKKAFEDNKLKCLKLKKLSDEPENLVLKGENIVY